MDSSGNVVQEIPALSALFGSKIPDSGISVSNLKLTVFEVIIVPCFVAVSMVASYY